MPSAPVATRAIRRGPRKTYVVDAAAFDAMRRRLSVLEGIALGEHDVRAGRIVSQSEAERRLARWLK